MKTPTKKSFCFILTKPRAHETIQMVSLSIKQFGPNPGGRRQDQASPDKEVWGLFFSLLLIHIQRNPGIFPGSCCSLRPTPSGCLGDLDPPNAPGAEVWEEGLGTQPVPHSAVLAHPALAVLAALEGFLQLEQMLRCRPWLAAQLSGMPRGAGAQGTGCLAGGGKKLPENSRSCTYRRKCGCA